MIILLIGRSLTVYTWQCNTRVARYHANHSCIKLPCKTAGATLDPVFCYLTRENAKVSFGNNHKADTVFVRLLKGRVVIALYCPFFIISIIRVKEGYASQIAICKYTLSRSQT